MAAFVPRLIKRGPAFLFHPLPHNERSLREMRGWVDEIDSAGISIIPRNGQGATDTQRNFEYSGRDDGRHESEMAILDELEGGGPKAAVEGRVPLLVVGNKEDLHGHSNHSGDGSAFAAELSAGYVTLVSDEAYIRNVWR